MVRKQRERTSEMEPDAADSLPPIFAGMGSATTTGRFMIVFKDEVVGGAAVTAVSDTMANVAGIRNLARASDFENSAVSAEDLANTEGIYFDRVGVAVVSAERAAIQSLETASVASGSPIMVIEPEYFSFASNGLTGVPLEYLRGYRDAVNHLYDGLTGPAVETAVAGMPVGGFNDTSQLTWGLQATKVHSSHFSGQGVNVAVLDTGIDLDHPDFQGREIVKESFINAQTVQDGHGHGRTVSVRRVVQSYRLVVSGDMALPLGRQSMRGRCSETMVAG